MAMRTANAAATERLTTPSAARVLWLSGWVFAAGSLVHLFDHLRRGTDSISETLSRLGNVGLVIQAVTVTLILTRHHLAPKVAAIAGFALAAGFAAAHWLPEWSSLSDPVWQIDSVVWFSAFASGLEIAGALAVGIAGVRCLVDSAAR